MIEKCLMSSAFVLSMGLMPAAGTMGLSGPAQAGTDWIQDYEAGRQAARASGKPIFLVLRCER